MAVRDCVAVADGVNVLSVADQVAVADGVNVLTVGEIVSVSEKVSVLAVPDWVLVSEGVPVLAVAEAVLVTLDVAVLTVPDGVPVYDNVSVLRVPVSVVVGVPVLTVGDTVTLGDGVTVVGVAEPVEVADTVSVLRVTDAVPVEVAVSVLDAVRVAAGAVLVQVVTPSNGCPAPGQLAPTKLGVPDQPVSHDAAPRSARTQPDSPNSHRLAPRSLSVPSGKVHATADDDRAWAGHRCYRAQWTASIGRNSMPAGGHTGAEHGAPTRLEVSKDSGARARTSRGTRWTPKGRGATACNSVASVTGGSPISLQRHKRAPSASFVARALGRVQGASRELTKWPRNALHAQDSEGPDGARIRTGC